MSSGTIASVSGSTLTLAGAGWTGGTPPVGTPYWVVAGSIVTTGLAANASYTAAGLTDNMQTFGALAGDVAIAGSSTGRIGTNGAHTITLNASGWSNATPATGKAPYWVLTGTTAASGSGSMVTYSPNGLTDMSAQASNFVNIIGATVVAGSSWGTVASATVTAITLTSSWNNGQPLDQTAYTVFGSSVVATGGGVSCFYYGAPTTPTYRSTNCPGMTTPPVPGQTYLVDPRGFSELHQFDTSFRVTGIEDALGDDWQYTYEDVTSCSTPSANNGNLCTITDPFGHALPFAYDGRGNVTSATDQLSHTRRYTYTGLNDILTVTDPRTAAPCAQPNPCVTTYGYTSGNLTSVQDASHNTTNLSYTDATNPGLVTQVTDPLTHATSFGHDSYGDLTTVTDAMTPADVFTYAYDAGGRLTSVTDAMSPARTTNYAYDAMNDLTSVTDANQPTRGVTTYAYDNVGNRTSATNPRTDGPCATGCVTAYGYDPANRLASVRDPRLRVTSYTYDANNNLITLTDPLRQTTGNHTTYSYDGANRLINIAYPDIHYRTGFTYWADGTRNTMTDVRGQCDSVACTPDTTTYAYDDARRLKTVTTTYRGNTRAVGYNYDEANNRTNLTYPDLTTVAYTYDEENRMKTVAPSWLGSPFTYGTYDSAGRLPGITYPSASGLTVAYAYDAANRLNNVTNKQGATPLSAFTYIPNPNGNRSSVQVNGGTPTTYGYDPLDRLNTVTNGANTTTYLYDATGNRTSVQVNGGTPTTYTNDAADQLAQISSVATANTYDKDGNLLSIGTGANLTDTFLYDQENRLYRTGGCRADVTGHGTVGFADLIAFAARYNGDEGSGAYDLTFDFTADGTISFADLLVLSGEYNKTCYNTVANTGNERNYYNGDGLRVRAVTFPSPGTTPTTDDYIWDQGAGLPVLLQDTSSGASGTTKYVYGLGLLAKTDGGGNTSYYLTDGLGSTAQLTDAAGNVTESYTYDEWGVAQTQPSTSSNGFRFSGQQDDFGANRGLYYLRARHYDPALGRFLSKDPLPLLQRYSYAHEDPSTLIDPSGLCGISWRPSSYTDCPVVAATKAAHYGINYVNDEASRIGLEKSTIVLLTTLTCAGAIAAPESVVLPAVCAAGVFGYGFAQITQWSAICKGAAEGKYSNDTAYAKNVLAWSPLPLPGGPVQRLIEGHLLEPILARGPKLALRCGTGSTAFAAELSSKP